MEATSLMHTIVDGAQFKGLQVTAQVKVLIVPAAMLAPSGPGTPCAPEAPAEPAAPVEPVTPVAPCAPAAPVTN